MGEFMIIIERDGKQYALTEEEIQKVATELNRRAEAARLEKEQQRELELKKALEKKRKWANYQKTTAKTLPYPQNLLLGKVLDYEDGEKFLEGSEEYKNEIFAVLLQAMNGLPEKRRLALEYRFRDKKKRKECADLLGCKITQYEWMRDESIRHIRRYL